MNRVPNDETKEKRCNDADHPAAAFSAYAVIARAQRLAALNALTGQNAHRMRNPLAAIQAACSSLRDDIQDPDHQQRLELILQEVAHTLLLISADVQAVNQPEEPPCEIDAVGEIASIIEIAQAMDSNAHEIEWQAHPAANCFAPRMAFRVAVFGLLEQLIAGPAANRIQIALHCGDERLQIRFTAESITGERRAAFEPSSLSPTEPVDVLGLQIAERFARDAKGRLKRWMPEDGSEIITLDLPCVNG